jgi:hypothetical protein
MQTAAPSTSDFAHLLSTLTSTQQAATDPWDDSARADDVATISYERALQAHARMKPVTNSAPKSTIPRRTSGNAPKTSVITLRLSQAESAQLHERAAEACLTVSAYVRSCVFEAEDLRAQVKEALSQFRSPASHVNRDSAPPPSPTWRNRLFSLWQG